jgi:hypothetical protein
MRLISLGSLLSIGLAVVVTAACTSGGEGDDTTGGDGDGDGTGGTSGDGDGTGGTTGDGDGTGGTTGDGDWAACLPALEADFLDFTYDATAMGGAGPQSTTVGEFGDYTTTFSGGTFVYPLPGITSDVTGSDWHMSGTVDNYAGFGLFFANCHLLDASAYSGIRLTISGDAGGAITAIVGTAANEITADWLNENTNPAEVVVGAGRCTPATGQYDGTCGAPSYTLPAVTDTPQTIDIMWEDLAGGSPMGSLNPAEITFITWIFTWADGATPYDVDITVDDISFIE